jgi:hypothetical protein
VSLYVGPVARSPRVPRAGRPFTASWPVTAADPAELVRGGRLTCKARGGGSSLRLVARSLRRKATSVVATCRWRLPRATRGKRVRGSVAVRYGDRVVRRPFVFRAR